MYESTGVKEAEDPIKIGNNSFKGRLIYSAQFVPAYALRGIRFDSGPNQIEQAAERSKAGTPDSNAGGSVRDDDESEIDVEIAQGRVTVSAPVDDERPVNGTGEANGNGNGNGAALGHNKTDSVVTTSSARTSGSTAVEEKRQEPEEPEEPQGIEMSREELLKHRAYFLSRLFTGLEIASDARCSNHAEAGVIIFNVVSGRLHKKARLEVLLDEGYWPAFSTARARSQHAVWEHIGEGVVKELDFSRVWLRLNEADEGDKDDVIAEWKGDSKAFLEKTLVRCFLAIFETSEC